jgi:hypothetical protein
MPRQVQHIIRECVETIERPMKRIPITFISEGERLRRCVKNARRLKRPAANTLQAISSAIRQGALKRWSSQAYLSHDSASAQEHPQQHASFLRPARSAPLSCQPRLADLEMLHESVAAGEHCRRRVATSGRGIASGET